MSSQLSSPAQTVASPIFTDSATQEHELGSITFAADGRKFRYAKAGAAALVAGTLLQNAAEITNHQGLAVTAASAGATTVTVTLGATAATLNQYAGGYACVTVTPGLGQVLKIKSHPAADASAAVVLTLEDPVAVALTTSSKIDLVANLYNGVIINPTTATGCPVGVAINAITAAQFGWIQVQGPAPLLAAGANAVSNFVTSSEAVAGAVTDATHVAESAIGNCVTGAADTEVGLVLIALS